ncbi:MAG: hypothetical protein KJO84_10215, partial [Acidimicrobiia bacterium]|nr:hypothetical protein [Acidimicrobiia bacterium]
MIVVGQSFMDRVEEYIPDVLATLGILVGFWILFRAVKTIGQRVVDRMKSRLPETPRGVERGQRLNTLWAVATRTLAVVVFVVAVLTIMIVWG